MDPSPPAASEQVWTTFASAWALVLLIDRVNWGRGADDLATWLLWTGFVLVWWAPQSVATFAVLCGTHLVWVVRDFGPDMFIHRFVAGLFDATVLAVLFVEAWSWQRYSPDVRERAATSERWTRRVSALRGPALAFVAIGMGAAGFAKLNRDFLDPDWSCGLVMYRWLQQSLVLPFLPSGPAAERVATVATIVGELGGGTLVLFRRTRCVGVALLAGTCVTIGLIPGFHLFEFSGLFLAMAIVVVDPSWLARGTAIFVDVATNVGCGAVSRHRTLPRCRVVVVGGYTVACSLAVWGEALGFERHLMREAMRGLSIAGALGLVTVHAVGAWGSRGRVDASSPRVALHPAWLFVAWFLLNEVSVYVGLWHTPSMTMAGNVWLQPGRSNHLLVNPIWVSPATRPISIERSSIAELHAGDMLPWLLFADILARHPRARVTFVDNGVREHVVAGKDERFDRRRWLAWLLHLRAWRDPVAPLSCNKPPPEMDLTQWHEHVQRVAAQRSRLVDR